VLAEDGFRLEDYLAVPFSFKAIDGFVFAEVSESEVFGVGRWREDDFNYARLRRIRAKAAMRRGEPAEGWWIVGQERVDGGEEVCEAYL